MLLLRILTLARFTNKHTLMADLYTCASTQYNRRPLSAAPDLCKTSERDVYANTIMDPGRIRCHRLSLCKDLTVTASSEEHAPSLPLFPLVSY